MPTFAAAYSLLSSNHLLLINCMSHEMNACKSVSVCEDGCRFYLSVKCPSIFQIIQKENSQNLLFIEVLRVFLEVPGGFEPP